MAIKKPYIIEGLEKLEVMYKNNPDPSRTISDMARELKIPDYTATGHIRAIDCGYKNETEYLKAVVKKRRGCESLTDYKNLLDARKGVIRKPHSRPKIPEDMRDPRTNYQEERAIIRGYKSLSDFQKAEAQKRQGRMINQRISLLLEEQLALLGKDKTWLANELGVSQSAVSRYYSGKTLPGKDIQERFFEILGLPYTSIDQILGEK